jgi:antitoxin HicB
MRRYALIAPCWLRAAKEMARPTRRTTMRYTVVLEQEEDGGYVVSVPALPGCVSQGDNRAEALKNIREAIELYVEDCREAGDPVPTEAGKEFVEIEAA